MPQATFSSTPTDTATWEPRGDIDSQVIPLLEELHHLPGDDSRRHDLRNRVVARAMPLADRLAKRFERRGEPLEDLTQVARLGLVNAVDNFKTGQGAGFSRFAVPSILGELKRYFRDKGWMIRVPRRLKETRLAYNEASSHLQQRLGRSPTIQDYAEYLAMPASQVRAGIGCAGAYDAVSLHAPAHCDSGMSVADTLGCKDAALESADSRITLFSLVKRLPARERTVLLLRFGHDLHQREIAQRLSLSQMHVSRLLRQTLTKLREQMDA